MILKVLSGILWILFLGTVIYGSMFWLLCLTDWEKTVHVKKGKRRVLGGIAVGNAIAVILICRMEEQMGIGAVGKQAFRMGATEILLSLLAGGLLAAACMDAENCYVYNYVWWWCLLWTGSLCGISAAGQNTAGGLWRIADQTGMRQMASVVLFVFLQQYLFARMYGRADSHAFSVCALAGCHWRGEMLWFLIHMLLALSLLAVVQLRKGNVTRRGRLRTPEPFIPYIVITFWAEIVGMLCLRGGLTHIYA